MVWEDRIANSSFFVSANYEEGSERQMESKCEYHMRPGKLVGEKLGKKGRLKR
jgi:hypothetical protein